MDVKNFLIKLKENTTPDEKISSATFFFDNDVIYEENFHSYVRKIETITTFRAACDLFNITEDDVTIIKIFNSKPSQENYIFFNPKYLDTLKTDTYHKPPHARLDIKVDSYSENTKSLLDYLKNYKNLFNTFTSNKGSKFNSKGVKKISSEFFFETTENEFIMKLYVTNERIYAGGRLSLPNSISFKLVDATIIYQSKIVFSRESLSTPESFEKYVRIYESVFYRSTNLVHLNISEATFRFTISIEKPIRNYVSFHSKDIFRIKRNGDEFIVTFKNIKSFESFLIRKYLLDSEIEHYDLWLKIVNRLDMLKFDKNILVKSCESFL